MLGSIFVLEIKMQFVHKLMFLKWYYDKKKTFTLDLETMFTKHSPREILNLNLEKTVYLTAIFRLNGPPLLYQKGYNDVIYSRALECIV